MTFSKLMDLLRGFTWPQEPVLYIGFLTAALNVARAFFLTDGAGWDEAHQSLMIAAGAFFARSKVSPALS